MKKKTTEQFIEEAKKVFPNNKYDYSLVKYKNNKTKIKIKCNTCNNIFETTPEHHLLKCNCPYCSGKHFFTKDEINKLIKNKFGDKFYFCLNDNEYFSKTKIKFKCKDCGYSFVQIPLHLLQTKNGCNMCNIHKKQSFGEKTIEKYLKENNIKFYREYSFDDLVGLNNKKTKLRFDFYLSENNIVIEYQGKQYYEYISFIHKNIKNFENSKLRDELKRKYCRKNLLNEIEIKYNENIIETLNHIFKEK